MPDRRHSMLGSYAVAAATVSLLVGPTVGAAFADCCRRQADEKARRTAPQKPADSAPRKEQDRPASRDWVSSFLPKASKPDHLKVQTPDCSMAPCPRLEGQTSGEAVSLECDAVLPLQLLHQPAFLPHAPPASA